MENTETGVNKANDSITPIDHESEIVTRFTDGDIVNAMAENQTSTRNINENSDEINLSYSDPENDLESKMDKSKTTISASDILAYQVKNPEPPKPYPVQKFTVETSAKLSKNAIAPKTEYNTSIVQDAIVRRWRVWPGNNTFYCSGRIQG